MVVMVGFFDYGPLGAELKKNVKDLAHRDFVRRYPNVHLYDGSIITRPRVWKSSGHTERFFDWVAVTKNGKKTRADHLIEEAIGQQTDGLGADELKAIIDKHNITFLDKPITRIEKFNNMFVCDDGSKKDVYLRPETCQNIFANGHLLINYARHKLPFGIVQMGKAFRNEINPRNFVFRCKEFEQIELEWFYNPMFPYESLRQSPQVLSTEVNFLSADAQHNTQSGTPPVITVMALANLTTIVNSHHIQWIANFYNWLIITIGLPPEKLRIRQHLPDELSHYSSATFDIEYCYEFGFKELMGIADRSNYDLSQHHANTSARFTVSLPNKQKIIPSVIESSIGIDRLVFAILDSAYCPDTKRTVLSLPRDLSPYVAAVIPLKQEPQLVKVAEDIFTDLCDLRLMLESDSNYIGKTYYRHDAIGTKYCITVDFNTLEDKCVTVRDRDTTSQIRLPIAELRLYLIKN